MLIMLTKVTFLNKFSRAINGTKFYFNMWVINIQIPQ